jgi:hypothetical protein
MDISTIGKWVVLAGLGMVFVGGLVWLLGKSGLPLGNLPGDVSIQRERFSFYFPIVTCIVLSIVLTLLINLILRFLGK